MADLHRFTLKQLRHFLVVAECRTIHAAAARLNLSHAALAGSLTELENQLGLQLCIRRRAHGVELTALGSELRSYAQAVLASADELQARAEGTESAYTGRLVIDCYASLAPFLVPALLAGVRLRYPALELEILDGSAEEMLARLHSGRSEFALLYDFNLTAAIECDPLISVKPRVLLPATHRLAARRAVDLKDLASEPLIQYDVAPAVENTKTIFRNVGVEPLIGRRAKSVELIRSLVGRGLGYAVLLHHPPGTTSYEGRELVIRDIRRCTVAFNVVLARSAYIKPSRRSTELRQLCVACCQTLT
jgi:DNA-binding transcriptional LysR family regulator